jgi:hypothetical protein
MKDLGFLDKPGVETKAAHDTQAYVANPPRPRGAFGRSGGRGGSGRGGAGRGPAQ